MSLSPDQPPARPRRSRALRVLKLAAKRLLPPLLGLVVLLGAAFALAGPGIPGLPRLGSARATPTPLPLVRTGAPAPAAAPTGAPTDDSSQQAPAQATPLPLPTPRPVNIPSGPQLRVPLSGIPVLDPGLAADSNSIDLIRNLFEGLLVADDTGALVPAEAESYEVSADGLTYTFVISSKARWSDGTPVRAADYEFAWKRNVDPRTQSLYAPALFPIKNAERINRQGASPSMLGVRAVDDHTLKVTLERPIAYFPWLVATWTYYPLRADQLQQYGKLWVLPGRMISNGPFTLEASSNQNELLLIRNPQYGGDPPQLAAIIYRAYSRVEDVFADYQKGNLDAMPVPASLMPQIDKDAELKAQLKTYPISSTSFIVLNTRRPGLNDPRVRQALGMTIQRQELLDTVLQQPGEVATSLHPPGIAGRDPSAWPPEDVDKAKQLLADAGYPGGKGFPALVYAAFEPNDPLATYLAKRWQDTLGIKLNVVLVQDPNDMFRHSQEWEQKVDMYSAGWNSDYVDPSNWFNLLWDSANDPGQYNSGWKNDQFDTLVRAAQAEQNEAARAEQYHKAEVIMAHDYPIIPLFHPAQRYLVKPNVRGFGPGKTGVAPPLARVRITQ